MFHVQFGPIGEDSTVTLGSRGENVQFTHIRGPSSTPGKPIPAKLSGFRRWTGGTIWHRFRLLIHEAPKADPPDVV